mgnify:CR=1 FL=1
MIDICDRPLAAAPLKSYRYKGAYGWIMIGARDDADALIQAARSFSDKRLTANEDNLERWNGYFYEPTT